MTRAAGAAQLTAGWAIWGKRPGSRDDYQVLESSSEPVDARDFAQILDYFEPGTPPTERGRPDSLPWVTISWMSLSDQPYVGMALQDATGAVDRVGRPITRTYYFCFPYASLASGPVSYLDLYQALAAVRLPRPQGAPVQVSVPLLDPARLADDMAELGEAAVSSAAALLLRGTVSIVGADGSTLEERLRFLDAVAALLPYGYRAGNTAATWSDSGVRHRIKLAFAARTKEGASGVTWRGAQLPPEGIADPAASFYRRFRALRERRLPGHGLAELVGFLSRDTAARRFAEPDPAIAALREFDLPFAVLDDVRRQTADPGEVRQVFAAGRITELPGDRRSDLLAALIAFGDPADLDAAGTWWDRAAGGDPGVLVTALAGPARGFFWRPKPDHLAAGAYLRLAAGHGLTDPLLARLVPPAASHPDLAAGRDAVTRAITENVLADQPAAAFPLTRQALAASPVTCCTLVARLIGHEPGPAAALDWLQPVTGGLLDPFAAVARVLPTAVEPSQIGTLVWHDRECARLLLAAAARAGRLDRVLPGMAAWLSTTIAESAAVDPLDTRYWSDVLTALPADTADTRAWTDLALLALGADVRFLLGDEASGPAYSRAFAAGWGQLATLPDGQAIDEVLTRGFTGCLRGRPWSRDQARASSVADIVERLAAGGARRRLEAEVAATMAASPGARAWQAVTGWLDRLHRDRPEAVREGTFMLLRDPPADASAAELAGLCAQAFVNGLPAREAAAALAESGALHTGAAAARIVDELRLLLPDPGPPAEWVLDFTRVNASGAVGWPAAREFRELSVSQSLEEIEYRLQLLSAGSGGQPGTAPVALPDEAIRRLELIGRTIDQVIKANRPRTTWLRQRKDDERPGEATRAEPDRGPGR